MDRKNVNGTYIICNIIMAVLLVLSTAKTVYVQKANAAVRQEVEWQVDKSEEITAEIKRQVDRAEEIAAERKRQVDRYEEIYGRYTEALNRNTASNEELIRILRCIDQQEEEHAWKE